MKKSSVFISLKLCLIGKLVLTFFFLFNFLFSSAPSRSVAPSQSFSLSPLSHSIFFFSIARLISFKKKKYLRLSFIFFFITDSSTHFPSSSLFFFFILFYNDADNEILCLPPPSLLSPLLSSFPSQYFLFLHHQANISFPNT